jgi:hypothetical protein
MEPNRSPHDKEIIELLVNLDSKVEYPPELLAARRAAFIDKIQEHNKGEIEQAARKQFTKRLKELQSVRAEYPAELLAARRAAFIAQIEQQSAAEAVEEIHAEDEQIFELLKSIKAAETEIPPDVLAARRVAFIARIEQQAAVQTEVVEGLLPQDQQLLKLLKKVKAAEADYPPKMLASRRAAFLRRMALADGYSLLESLRASLQRLFAWKVTLPSLPTASVMRTSALIAVLMLVAFISSLWQSRDQSMRPAPDQGEIAQPVPVLATHTLEAAIVICKPGYLPPLCLAKEFEPEQDLTAQDNGVARPAVAKDTVPGHSSIHDPAFVNDGLYGPGSSWVSNSAYSWIKIDLGKLTTINTVTFGRDRLGHIQDGNPGQFVIAIALSDNVYADGNSSNDYVEYTQVYNSTQDGFNGVIAGPQTVRAAFNPVAARFVKIIFANAGTTVDEVEVFMIQPPVLAENPTRRPREDEPIFIATPVPTLTLRPTHTASVVPTATLVPTDTATSTPRPTNTPLPTNTPTDPPTATNTPPPTRTPTAIPTDTPAPTSTPQPTNTRPPTDTPVPPQPTDTLAPPVAETASAIATSMP